MELNEKEIKLINLIRNIKYGQVVVIIEDKQLKRVEETKKILL